MDFKRQSQKFVSLGVDLNNPVDLIPPGKFPFLKNARSYQEGRLDARTGVTKINTSAIADNNIHSVYATNDYVAIDFLRFLGADTKLYTGQTSFSLLDTGYSGDPLSFVPYRPDKSAQVWTYIANYNKMRKVRQDGTNYVVGVAPPTVIPGMELTVPLYATSANFEVGGSWTAHGSVSGISTGARLAGITIGTILYISGTTGWAGIIPTGGNIQDITAGMKITVSGTETAFVEEVHKIDTPVSGVTISTVIYDSGSIGICTIQPSQTLEGIKRNSIIGIGSIFVRVLSTALGPDGLLSFRCDSGATTLAAGNTITVPIASFWLYLTGTHVAGAALTNPITNFAVNPGGAGSGVLANNLGFAGPGYNFGSISGRQVSPDDYIHISIKIDKPDRLLEGKLILDVDRATTNTYSANDGNRNAFYKAFRANDFQGVVAGTQTEDSSQSQAVRLQTQSNVEISLATNQPDNSLRSPDDQLNTPGDQPVVEDIPEAPTTLPDPTPVDPIPDAPPTATPTSQLILGESQWTEFIWKVSDLVRVGSDISTGLFNIGAVQLRFSVTNDINVSIANIWVGGTYGPDTSKDLTPILYRYRYRSSVTGAKSLPGPATRTGIDTKRQGVALTATSSMDAQVDKIDFERLGGDVLDWHYIGTCDNSSPTFLDSQFSAAIITNPPLDIDVFQPFPVSDVPKVLTVTVAGTAVTRVSGDNINLAWARGMEVIINGKLTTLYASPTSTSVFHIVDSLGTATSVTMEIPEPILAGQPLPVIWGPFEECLLACGNAKDAGSVYFTKPTNPDAAPDTNKIEVVSPSENMMNGCLYDSRCFAWSDKRFFAVIPQNHPTIRFRFVEVNSGRGLFARWAFCIGPKIWFLASDGIYETEGGSPVCISDDIAPLFPRGDRAAFAVNGMNPIAMDLAGGGSEAGNLRLTHHQGYLIFDYIDTTGAPRTIFYEIATKAWYPDLYWEGSSPAKGFVCHFSESGARAGDEVANLLGGSNHGVLYVHSGTSDDGTAIQCRVDTPAFNANETRANKLFGDIVFDLNAKAATITATPYIDNYVTALTAKTYSGASRTITNPIDLGAITDGTGIFAKNIGVRLTWSSSTVAPELYFWEPSWVVIPENTFKRATDWSDGGYAGSKLIRGLLIEADTENASRTVKLQGDQVDLQTLTIQHNGQLIKPYPITPPKIASELRLLPTDANFWRLFRVSYLYDKYSEYTSFTEEWNNLGFEGRKYIYGLVIEADTQNAVISVQIQSDILGSEGFLTRTLTGVVHNGRVVLPYYFPEFQAHLVRIVPVGNWRLFSVRWMFDPNPEVSRFSPDFSDMGFFGPKYIRAVRVEADTLNNTITIQVQKNETVGITDQTFSLSCNGREEIEIPLTPFIAHEARLIPLGNWALYKVTWVFDEYPELDTTITPYLDGGYRGAKFVQGVLIEAAGVANVDAQYDAEQSMGLLALNHPGIVLSTKPYSFANPVIAHDLRLRPLNPVRLGRIDWVYEPAPELTTFWRTQGTTHDVSGYQFLKDGYIAHVSTADLTLEITVDDETIFTYTIPHSNGGYNKSYLIFGINPTGKSLKGKTYEYYLHSPAGFRLFVRDSEVRTHPWTGGGYIVVHPFGDEHRIAGAKI